MAQSPIVLSGLGCFCYAIWAVLQKMASSKLTPNEAQLYTTAMMFALCVGASVAAGDVRVQNAPVRPFLFAAVSGIFTYIGGLLYTTALSNGGSVGLVSAITASYPSIAFVLSVVLLGDEVAPNKIAGLVFAIASAAAFAYEPAAAVAPKTD